MVFLISNLLLESIFNFRKWLNGINFALSKTEHSILHDYPHTSNNSLSPKKVLKKEKKKLDKSEVLIDINL